MNEDVAKETAWQIRAARDFRSRLVGLLGRRRLADREGLWIEPCAAVHTMGMRFPIDVLFLSSEHRIIAIEPDVRPWRWRACRRARIAVELPAGSIRRNRWTIGRHWPIEVKR